MRLAEIDKRLEKLVIQNSPIDYTHEIKTRVKIARVNIEKDHWLSRVRQYAGIKRKEYRTFEL